jgi:hypothetical protein
MRHRRRHGHRSRRLGDLLTFAWRLLRRRRLLRRPLTRGKERERVEVPVRLGGQPDAEMDVRLRPFGLSTRADRPHDLPLADRCSDSERDRPQVDEGDRVPVLRADRQTAAFARQLTGEGDDPGRRSAHLGSRRRADVDPAMLAARVRVVLGDERPEHRPLDRPAPRGRARDMGERDEQHGAQDHEPVARFENHAGKRIEPIGCCQI